MLSDKVVHRKGRRSKENPNGWYRDSQKLDAIKLYLVSGNLTATAAALNIPLSTIKLWKGSKWWKELTEELKREGNIQLSNKLKTIASRALDVTMDRLENGDFQYDPKTGEMIRKPVLMRDAHRVASDLITRQMEVDKGPVDEETNKATQDRLEALAKTFAGFAKKVKRIEVMDVEDIGETYKTITGARSQETQGNGLQTLEQDGSYERGGTDSEGPGEELYDSGGKS